MLGDGRFDLSEAGRNAEVGFVGLLLGTVILAFWPAEAD